LRHFLFVLYFNYCTISLYCHYTDSVHRTQQHRFDTPPWLLLATTALLTGLRNSRKYLRARNDEEEVVEHADEGRMRESRTGRSLMDIGDGAEATFHAAGAVGVKEMAQAIVEGAWSKRARRLQRRTERRNRLC
jgi:hypothetical protein